MSGFLDGGDARWATVIISTTDSWNIRSDTLQTPHADRERILELLEHKGGVTAETVRVVARETGIPEADVWGAGTFYSLIDTPGKRVRVCDGLTCQMLGADAIAESIHQSGRSCERVSCLGQCDLAPATLDEDMELVTYAKHETTITPCDDELAINLAGPVDRSYAALKKVRAMSADEVIALLEMSGLQGRGGAGFPAHFKWRSVCDQRETERYVICNADEAEPGTFKDRELILRQPHKMLEGLAIAAVTIQTDQIYVYIRGEYTNEYRELERAIAEVSGVGGPLADFEITLVKGHGAYICGEETALLESLEGKRGMPRLKPPYPTESGFRGKPSLIHNVETIACVPAIVHRGGEWFKSLGRTEAGSKLYCISGHVKNPGVLRVAVGRDAGRTGRCSGWLCRKSSRVFSGRSVERLSADFGIEVAAGLQALSRRRFDDGQCRRRRHQRHRRHGAGGRVAVAVFRARELRAVCALPHRNAVPAAADRSVYPARRSRAVEVCRRCRLGDGGGVDLRAGDGRGKTIGIGPEVFSRGVQFAREIDEVWPDSFAIACFEH